MRTSSTLVAVCFLLAAGSVEALAAGAVTVTETSGTLSIVGDADANALSVSDKDGNGTWDIVGKGGTTVNGASSLTTATITGDIDIDLGGGDDSIKLTGGNVPGHLSVLMGAGNDKAVISNVTVGDYFEFEGNADDDSLTIKGITVTDVGDAFSSSISMDNALGAGTGNDSAKVKGFVDQELSVFLGGGDDKFALASSTFGASANAALTVDGNGGSDIVSLKDVSVPGALNVDMGAADDTLTILSCTATSNDITGGLGTGDKLKQNGNSLGTPAPGSPASFEY